MNQYYLECYLASHCLNKCLVSFSFLYNPFNVQVGYDKQGLPIGLQLIGRPWGEASILRLAAAVEVCTTI